MIVEALFHSIKDFLKWKSSNAFGILKFHLQHCTTFSKLQS